MNYNVMSGQNLNELGRVKYKSNMQSEAALNATKIRNLIPNTIVTDIVRDNYAPYTRFYIENINASITIQVSIGGQGLGDDTIQNAVKTINLIPNAFLEIEPTDNIKFTMIAIKNTHAANNTAAGDIRWFVSNY